ncbi:dihydrolipoamide acetyltransferase family protein [Auritidibacter ignavus]|uniref:dihydrolipoamide acetyltransferase family protein n=1 Tax=Auritidibacter ignavus TaxID=678932 RepID=UPI000D73573E|nr:branched-chain alpha-keto acid dehydrogenase subunit E2 [Auritidibacter sp. NML120779]
MTAFNLPDLGEGLTEATLLSWLVTEGDTVTIDQPIAEVETAKATLEIPSPFEGTVTTLHGKVGETLTVGEPLITVTAASHSNASEAGALSHREEEQAGSGNVLIGYGTSNTTHRRRRHRNHTAHLNHAGDSPNQAKRGLPKAPRVSSPLVRRLARQQGLELTSLKGTGPNGLITRADVLAKTQDASTPANPPSENVDSSLVSREIDSYTGLPIRERTPVAGIRKATTDKLTRSRTEIPEATAWQDVDVTKLFNLRAELAASGPGQAPSILAFFSRFVVAGIKRYPILNSRVVNTGSGQEIIQFDGVNLGFAAQTDIGLVVPVIREAHLLSAKDLHDEIHRLATSARDKKLTGKYLTGGTFTVNNYGVFGSDGATPIINHPETGIMGMGRIIDRPWVANGELAVRKVTTLTIAFDHRVCDGGAAGGFLNYVARCMESPESALADF